MCGGGGLLGAMALEPGAANAGGRRYDPQLPPGVRRHHHVYELQLLGKMLGQGGVRGLRSQVIPQLTGLG